MPAYQGDVQKSWTYISDPLICFVRKEWEHLFLHAEETQCFSVEFTPQGKKQLQNNGDFALPTVPDMWQCSQDIYTQVLLLFKGAIVSAVAVCTTKDKWWKIKLYHNEVERSLAQSKYDMKGLG